jgi:hypothetical protein|tara:strand:+ start:643 stop:876 length:234 start_codon:yes stop_codon:yes gene_type:complete
MNKKELQQLLQTMDHYTQYSDDYSVFTKGRKQAEYVEQQLQELFDKKSEALEFYNENTPDGVGYIQSYIDELKAEGN